MAMGEIADDIINGWCCDLCGQYFNEEHGYPATCSECWIGLTPKEKKHHSLAIFHLITPPEQNMLDEHGYQD